MSKFLTEVTKEKDDDSITKWIKIGERKDGKEIPKDLFDFIVQVGKHLHGSTAGITAYNWLKQCNRFYRDGDTFILNYTDRHSANWSLNFIGNGVKFSQNCRNVAVFHNGEYIDSLFPPDRKNGEVFMVRKY